MDKLEWWVYALSATGGIVSFKDVFKLEDTWKLTLIKFTAHIVTSVFAGAMSLLAALAVAVPKDWIPVVVGIMAWRGAKGLQVLSDAMDKWINARNGGK